MKRFAIAVLAACGGSDAPQLPDAPVSSDAGSDAGPTCTVSVTFDPEVPLAYPGAPPVRATARVTGASGVLDYTWQIRRGSTNAIVPSTKGAVDGSAADFIADTADSYDAIVQVTGAGGICNVTPYTVNVEAPGANTAQVRVRVLPPNGVAAPPQERRVLVKGNTASWSVGVVPVEPGTIANGTTNGLAYLRFIPQASPDAYVEAFAAMNGTFSVRVVNQLHDVLVVPMTPGLAPRRIRDWLPGQNLPVDAGSAISGSVLDHTDQPIADAMVQLVIGGVPTTLGRTDANGSFTVRASVTTGPSSIEVAPPPATGLPRIVASSAGAFATPIAIDYANTLQPRDLGGAVVRRGGTAIANAQVMIVGTFDAGTLNGATVTGEVRASATANASGALPTLRVPNRALDVVVTASDITRSSIAAGAISTIDAPAPPAIATVLRNSANQPLAGAIFEAVPRDTLAMAGVPIQRFVADANGAISGTLANGRYDFRSHDPDGADLARLAAPVVDANRSPAEIAASYTLPKAVKLRGGLSLAGNPLPVGSAIVQILCATCGGTERVLPLASGAATAAGRFDVAVGDPGTMPP